MKEDNITIVPAKIGDAECICNVTVKTWHSTYKGIMPDEILNNQIVCPEFVEKWRNRIIQTQEGNDYIFSAKTYENRTVGFVWGGYCSPPVHHCDCRLYAFYVLEEFQKNGIGRKLFNHMTSVFKQNCKRKMIIGVLEGNRIGESFYIKNSAVRTDITSSEHGYYEREFILDII